MALGLYSSFKHFSFNSKICFLTGEEATVVSTVFPDWLLDKYQLSDRPIKLLDERIVSYQSITVPTSKNTAKNISDLNNELKEFFERGFEKIKALPEVRLFQWIGNLLYGMIYFEIGEAIKQQAGTDGNLNFSQSLIHKFENLQFMLHSLIVPVEFEGIKPWTILVFKVDNPPDTFSYRDEINTLSFSLRMNDFGIVACLQDNNSNRKYHQEMLEKIGEQTLHPIQFEEICARFFYSSYLFNRLPEYTILPTRETVYIEAMPFFSSSGKALFDQWQNKTYAQVLENFWKPWSVLMFEILKIPEKPLSFLFNQTGGLKTPEQAAEGIKTIAIRD